VLSGIGFLSSACSRNSHQKKKQGLRPVFLSLAVFPPRAVPHLVRRVHFPPRFVLGLGEDLFEFLPEGDLPVEALIHPLVAHLGIGRGRTVFLMGLAYRHALFKAFRKQGFQFRLLARRQVEGQHHLFALQGGLFVSRKFLQVLPAMTLAGHVLRGRAQTCQKEAGKDPRFHTIRFKDYYTS